MKLKRRNFLAVLAAAVAARKLPALEPVTTPMPTWAELERKLHPVMVAVERHPMRRVVHSGSPSVYWRAVNQLEVKQVADLQRQAFRIYAEMPWREGR